jgi:hypothetical protein
MFKVATANLLQLPGSILPLSEDRVSNGNTSWFELPRERIVEGKVAYSGSGCDCRSNAFLKHFTADLQEAIRVTLKIPMRIIRPSLPIAFPTALAVFGMALALSGVARAGTIPGLDSASFPGLSSGSIGPLGSTPSPNNDNVSGPSPNHIPYLVTYGLGGIGITEVEYLVVNSGGTTEYRITQSLVNNTGAMWVAMQFELGFGIGANFIRSSVADLLVFDIPERDPVPTSSSFPLLDHQADMMMWSAGSVPSPGSTDFTFAVDVPDNLQAFHPGGLNRFTIRQVQAVAAAAPEPGSLTLFILAGMPLARWLARRRPAGSRFSGRE